MEYLKYCNQPLGILDNRKQQSATGSGTTAGNAMMGTAQQAAQQFSSNMTSSMIQNGMSNLGGQAMNSLKSMKPSPAGAAGMAADLVSNFLPEKSEYKGDKGGTTQSLDGVYDRISDGIAMVPGWGTAASAIMKGAKVVNQGMNAIGGGTDGMTGADAVFGSNISMLDPTMYTLGLINGFTGKKSDTFAKNNSVFNQIGVSYGGTNSLANLATTKSGKKYGGLFSNGARKQANALMNNARQQQSTMNMIADNGAMNTEVLSNQASLMNNASIFEQSGGLDMNSMMAAKQGAKINLTTLTRARYALNHQTQEIPQHKEGNKINLRNQVFPKNVSRAIRLAKTGVKIPQTSVYNFEDCELTDEMISSLLGATPLYKDGGQMNLIPEGALHAHKHHMENDEDITKKGIPVVVEGEGGHLEQQAEIEKNEIILNKELTDKLESLYKKYYSEDVSSQEKDSLAIEAGELLAEDIMTNTDDRTGLMKQIN